MQTQHGNQIIDFKSLLYQYLTEVEGKRLVVYKDSKGIPTVGIGHRVVGTDRLKVGDKITEARSMQYFNEDYDRLNIATYANDVSTWPGNKRLGVASFVWSHGDGQYKNSSLRAYLVNNKPKADTLAYLRQNWDLKSSVNQLRNEKDITLFYSPVPYSGSGFFLRPQSLGRLGLSLQRALFGF